MGLLRSIKAGISQLLFPEDRFADWERSPDLDCLLDLDAYAVYGIALGETENALSKLGAPYAECGGLYSYSGDGLSFFAWDGKIKTLTISFVKDNESPEEKAFSGRVEFGGQTIILNDQTTMDDIVKLFGTSSEQYGDDEGTGVIYYMGMTDIHFKLGPSGTLLYIAINDVGEPDEEEMESQPAHTTDG